MGVSYPKAEVRSALGRARSAGKNVAMLQVDDRETAHQLERWGFLPEDPVATSEKVADWYRSQGLAARDHVARDKGPSATDAALAAAEAALGAAQAAIAAARMR